MVKGWFVKKWVSGRSAWVAGGKKSLVIIFVQSPLSVWAARTSPERTNPVLLYATPCRMNGPQCSVHGVSDHSV